MGCCICAGSCNHIGRHFYCAAHGGGTYPHASSNPYLEPAECEIRSANLIPLVVAVALLYGFVAFAIVAWFSN